MLNKKALSATAQVEKDSDFKSTVLLLHGDGTNGAQNNTFTDSSTNAFSITRNGNATQGTFSPFSQTGWSNYFDGTGDYLTAADNSALDLGSGDFTIEGWVYIPTAPSDSQIVTLFSKWGASGQRSWWVYFFNASGTYQIYLTYTTNGTSGGGDLYNEGFSFPAGQWAHIAIVRSTNTVKFYINGSVAGTGSENISTDTIFDSTTALSIGATASGGNPLTGYMSNFRLVKGTAVYTAAFTPPTAALTNITNTSLLTCQSNRFVDNSSNGFAITRNGDTSVQAFSPFAPTAAYSAGTNGGSGYFDGTGDYLSVAGATALNYGSGDFTIECWYYPTSTSNGEISAQGDGALPGSTYEIKFRNAGYLTINMYSTAGGVTVSFNTSKNWVLNAWNHVAVVRNGNTVTCYMDGVSAGTGDATGASFGVTDNVYVGAGLAGGNVYKGGYIANFRIVKGTAVYTTGFTPPTAPLTAISGTSLLSNFTNAGIIDSTAKNVLETVGNAQIDTGTKKFGTGSIYFDGTGDNLKIPHSVNQQFGTGDFTFEAWIYPTAITGTTVRDIVCKGQNGSGSFEIAVRDSKIRMYTDIVVFTSSSNVTANAWQHIALTRSGTTLRFFLDGALDTTTTSFSTNFNDTGDLFFGSYGNGTQNYFTGYIDDIRITKGVARYTAAFTAPTKAFADQ